MEMSYDIRGDTHIKRFKIYKKKRSVNKVYYAFHT